MDVFDPRQHAATDLAAALHGALADATELVVRLDRALQPHVAAICAVHGWYETERNDTDAVVTYRPGDDPRCTRYSLPVVEGNTTDSRWLVSQLAIGAPTVLELGCSEGLTTRTMAARGQHVVGVEFDPAAADSAARFAHGMVVADLDDPASLTALGDQQFDMILAADVLEHLRFPVAALQRALRHLAPGGSVVLSIPNLAHADVRMALLDGRVPYDELGLLDHTHIHWFTYDGVLALLAECGLVVTDWQRTVQPPNFAQVPFAADLRELNRQLFADDTDATTFQWVLRCGRASEVAEVADPVQRHNPRRHAALQAEPGIKASARLLKAAVLRRVRRGRRPGR